MICRPETHQVHSWPELAIDDLSVAWELGLPTCRVVAAKVVDVSGRALFAFDNRLRIAPEESQGEGDSFSRRLLYRGRGDTGRDARAPRARRHGFPFQREHDLIAHQIEGVARALRVVAHATVRLAPVLNERDRQARARHLPDPAFKG